MMYLAIAAGLCLTVWSTLVLFYATWLHRIETPEYKIVREYMRAMNRENEK